MHNFWKIERWFRSDAARLELGIAANGETVVECIVYDVDDLRAELMEIDENLQRAELSPAQEAAHIHRRKQIWDEMNSERNPSAIQRGPGRPKEFAAELSAITGDSKTQTNIKIARGVALGSDIHRIANTSLDKGVEMDALIKMPETERAELISRAEADTEPKTRRELTPPSLGYGLH